MRRVFVVALVLAVPVLAVVPYVDGSAEAPLFSLFTLVAMATLWNLMAGFAGLTSFGQQTYLGAGAYLLYLLADAGVDPFAGIALAAVGAALLAIPVSALVLRLHEGYFAIGTWVVAEVFHLLATVSPRVGGNTGTSLPGIGSYPPVLRQALVYWWALALMVCCVGGVYALLRSRFGLDARAVHADPVAAAAAGVIVGRVRWTAYVLAGLGFGAIGALLFAHDLYVQPGSAFGVQYSVYMMFMVVIGGLGTIEGPLLGALIFFALQQVLADQGAWYLVLLGALAMLVTLFAPRGVWGSAAAGRDVALLPIGHRLRPPARSAS
jgi:branched-chain amino acid transport system permease protein